MLSKAVIWPPFFVEGTMKIKKYLFLSLFGLCTTSFASETSYIAPLATESLLLDIAQNQSSLVVVGERGHLLISTDKGESWTQKAVPTKSTLTSVVTQGQNIWVAGHDAVILHSADNGETWTLQQFFPELQRPILDLHFFDSQHGIAIGAYGVFFRTRDGGNKWEREYHPSFLHPDDQSYLEELKEEDEAFYQEEMASILPHLNRVTQSNGRLMAVGESGLVAYSDDQGQNWQRVETNYYGSFFDIIKLEDGTVLAAGLRGNLYTSDSEMQTWQHVNTGTTATFNSIVPLSRSSAMLMGNNGTLVTYAESGVTLNKTEDGKNVISGTSTSGNIIAVSAVGIKKITRN